jgi:hypothetical protein
MQQFLKPAARIARAWVVAAELLEELFVAVHYAVTAFNASFGREALPALTRRLESSTGRGTSSWFSWHTSTPIPHEQGRGL